ncbi:hypothetical protein ACWELQ_41195, partial [Nocardia sp. NPDC004722]
LHLGCRGRDRPDHHQRRFRQGQQCAALRLRGGTRQVSVQDDLDLLDAVADDDPVIEELAARYLVP